MTMMLHSEVGRGGVEGEAPCRAVSLPPQEIGQRIVTARKEKRWSRLDLSTAMDVSPSSVYRWENGKLPSVHELMRLASVLDKPADYLTEPPERQAELGEVRDRLEQVHRLLEERQVRAVKVQEAVLENLASIHDRLVQIEERLDAQGELGSAHP